MSPDSNRVLAIDLGDERIGLAMSDGLGITAQPLETLQSAGLKNDLKEIVTFSFDRRHRLIGVIEQPADTLDLEELLLYINTLARECLNFAPQRLPWTTASSPLIPTMCGLSSMRVISS